MTKLEKLAGKIINKLKKVDKEREVSHAPEPGRHAFIKDSDAAYLIHSVVGKGDPDKEYFVCYRMHTNPQYASTYDMFAEKYEGAHPTITCIAALIIETWNEINVLEEDFEYVGKKIVSDEVLEQAALCRVAWAAGKYPYEVGVSHPVGMPIYEDIKIAGFHNAELHANERLSEILKSGAEVIKVKATLPDFFNK